jgi:hypothetical protein
MHFAIIEGLGYLEVAACVLTLGMICYRKQLGQFKPLVLFLATRIVSSAICLPVQKLSGHGLSRTLAYHIYFYTYWTSYAAEAILGFCIIYCVYNLAMAPLKGLQRLGMLMFRWAGAIAVAIALTMAFGPHVTSMSFIMRAVTQLQQTQSILTLCMLLFVCLAIQPMGLTYRSKIFGICLGLGVLAATDLVYSAWIVHLKAMYQTLDLVGGISTCLMLAIWFTYFAVPEPARRMIILPTTSPFLRWNQISMALGDAPGFVALGEFTPEMFAPAEVEVMRRASMKMQRAAAG